MLDPLREHPGTKIDVPATCPIGGNAEGTGGRPRKRSRTTRGRVMGQRSARGSPLRASFTVPVWWPAAAVHRRSPSSAEGAIPRLTCEFALRRTSADEA